MLGERGDVGATPAVEAQGDALLTLATQSQGSHSLPRVNGAAERQPLRFRLEVMFWPLSLPKGSIASAPLQLTPQESTGFATFPIVE